MVTVRYLFYKQREDGQNTSLTHPSLSPPCPRKVCGTYLLNNMNALSEFHLNIVVRISVVSIKRSVI